YDGEQEVTVPRGWFQQARVVERLVSCIAGKVEDEVHDLAAGKDVAALISAAGGKLMCCFVQDVGRQRRGRIGLVQRVSSMRDRGAASAPLVSPRETVTDEGAMVQSCGAGASPIQSWCELQLRPPPADSQPTRQ